MTLQRSRTLSLPLPCNVIVGWSGSCGSLVLVDRAAQNLRHRIRYAVRSVTGAAMPF